ncbi:MAG: hypothetical protein IIX96_01205 [Clostridia bacterium]|nr:hypothetical protein [Clostridia bacterium]
MAEKFSRIERARQFMPFSALKGFENLIDERNFIPTPRRRPSEEKAQSISLRLSKIKKGTAVEIIYYDVSSYKRLCGCVREIDTVFKRLTVGSVEVRFSDIFDIRLV